MTTKDINFWLNEPDLKTPIHDEMVLWAFNNYKELINPIINLEDFDIERKIEYALGGSYNIGFLDLCIMLKLKGKLRTDENLSKYKNICLKDTTDSWYCSGQIGIYFEIKPEVKSIGEVLRQISYYRKYLPYNHQFILITKTKGLKELFESQNIKVIEYESKKEEKNGNLN